MLKWFRDGLFSFRDDVYNTSYNFWLEEIWSNRRGPNGNRRQLHPVALRDSKWILQHFLRVQKSIPRSLEIVTGGGGEIKNDQKVRESSRSDIERDSIICILIGLLSCCELHRRELAFRTLPPAKPFSPKLYYNRAVNAITQVVWGATGLCGI